MKKHFASFNYIEILLPQDVVDMCSHSGSVDLDVDFCLNRRDIKKEMAKIDPEKLRLELKDYGAWDETELSNHSDNLKRILWIAACNISEEQD